MTSKEFKKIKDKYGKCASWAIWNPDNIKDLSVIEKNREYLNSNIIMIGLNVSAGIKNDWQNFHGGLYDRRLVKLFNIKPYRGAYITDFIKDYIEPNSKLVLKELDKPTVYKYKKEFEKEIEDIKAENPLIILFGGDSNKFVKVFKELFEKKFEKIINIPHFSSWGSDEEWIKKVKSKLK